MSFSLKFDLYRGEVVVVVSNSLSDPAVLVKCSNSFENLKDKSVVNQDMTFKIACPDDLVALKVSEFIKNKFDHGESVSFSGMPPKSGFVTVITPYDNFLS